MLPRTSNLHDRVVRAAEAVLKRSGSVGPLDLFSEMGFLHPVHFEAWRRGSEQYPVLEEWIQIGPEKFSKTIQHFLEWIQDKELIPVEREFEIAQRRGGTARLRLTADGDPERERFYRTSYRSPNLSPRQTKQVEKKLNKTPDLVVFIKVSEDGDCHECGTELAQGNFVFKENNNVLCLDCADLGHLLYLPAGDTALTRRARKHSSLSCVVVRWSRSRKRYERQGVLVTAQALQQAETECAADAPERAAARAKASLIREVEDRQLVKAMTEAILARFPGCPSKEAAQIAAHTALRGSGRVGRSAAGRALEADPLHLAVIAHIRHQHTRYDSLLMAGADRSDARAAIAKDIDQVLLKWTEPS